MKKIFTLISMIFAFSMGAMAQEVTIDFDADYATLFPTITGVSSGTSHDGDFTEATTSTEVSGVTVTVSPKASGNNENRIWGSSPRLRMYSGTLTFKSSDKSITKIEMDILTNGSEVAKGNTANAGTLAYTQGTKSGSNYNATLTWTGSEKEVVITIAGNTQFRKAVLTLSDATDTRAATTIDFAEGYATKVLADAPISVKVPTATVKAGETAVAGAAITWSSDNNKITIAADGTITATDQGTATITASYAGDANYKPSSKTYTLKAYKVYSTLKAMVDDVTSGNEKWKTGELVAYIIADLEGTVSPRQELITYVNKSYNYITDGTNNMLLYGSGLKLAQGDKLSSIVNLAEGDAQAIYGTLKNYNGLPELAIDACEATVVSTGNPVTAKTITVDDLAENVNNYIKIENAKYVSVDNKTFTFKLGETNLTVYNQFGADITFEENATYTIEGMGAVYTKNDATTYQVYLINAEKTGTAGVNGIEANAEETNAPIYNLAGQKVTKSYKGVVIQGGKKFINK